MVFDRDSAFTMDFSESEGANEDEIHSMISLSDSLIFITLDRVIQVLSAQEIDPGESNPETRHAYQELFSIGARNSYVARTIIQTDRLLKSVLLRDGLDKQALLDHVWASTKLLLSCEKSYYEVYRQAETLMPECDQIVETGKTSGYIRTLPQVENLEESIVAFLGYAKRFLEYTHALLVSFYSCPNSGANFSSYLERIRKHFPDSTKLIEMLQSDQDWIRELSHRRNALQANHSRDGYKIDIHNFALHPGNTFSPPSWQYDFSDGGGGCQADPTDIIMDLHTCMENMLTFFEEVFLLCLEDNWDDRYQFQICPIAESQVDQRCPLKYSVEIDPSSLFRSS